MDVSGHGVPAALLSVSAMNALAPSGGRSSLLREMGGAAGLGTVQSPAKAAAAFNQRYRTSDNDGRYMTMILVVLDTLTGELRFTSAGHTPPILLRGTERIELSDAGGVPIAIMDDAEYEEGRCQLSPGDRLYLFSDGLIEEFQPGGHEQFGTERIEASLKAGASKGLAEAIESTVKALSAWSGVSTFTDDVTLVAIMWRPG